MICSRISDLVRWVTLSVALCLSLGGEPARAEGSQSAGRPADSSDLLARLEAEIAANPDNVENRVQLAQTLYRMGRLPDAWQQLLDAHQLDRDNKIVSKGIGDLINVFNKRGLFAVGTPAKKIESTLGEAQAQLDMGSQRRWIYFYLAIDFEQDRIHEIIDMRGANDAWFHTDEIITGSLDDRNWQCGYRITQNGKSIASYFLPGQSLTDWREQVEVQRITNGAQIGSTHEIYNKISAQSSKQHPGSKHQLLHLDDNSLTVAWKIPARTNSEKRHQIIRFFKGAKDLHRISYTVMGDEPSLVEQKKWLTIFQSTRLKPIRASE